MTGVKSYMSTCLSSNAYQLLITAYAARGRHCQDILSRSICMSGTCLFATILDILSSIDVNNAHADTSLFREYSNVRLRLDCDRN